MYSMDWANHMTFQVLLLRKALSLNGDHRLHISLLPRCNEEAPRSDHSMNPSVLGKEAAIGIYRQQPAGWLCVGQS